MQKIKVYLILLSVLLILGLISLGLIVNAFAPDSSFKISLVYALSGFVGFATATLIGFYIRKLFGQREFLNNYIFQASRQGVWLAIILLVSLFLTRQGLFTWINAGLLALTFIFFESYLLTKDKPNNQN